jgi:hypothetical protein
MEVHHSISRKKRASGISVSINLLYIGLYSTARRSRSLGRGEQDMMGRAERQIMSSIFI